jgi:hypothetical protein
MNRITEIYCHYWCPSCKTNFTKMWREKPWFGDYAKRCECGRNVWPFRTKDYSRDEMSSSERRWDKK